MHSLAGKRFWGAVGFMAASVAAVAAPAKNVLLIIADDLRPDVGCYGDAEARTPNIDRLASEGVVFERAFCPQALCAPSRASFMTGVRPDTMKVWDVWTHFRTALPNAVTLPQLLKDHGWFTQALGKVYHTNLDDPQSWSVPHVMPADPIYAAPESKALLEKKRRAAEEAGLKGVELARAIRSGPAVEAPVVPDTALVDGEIADLTVHALQELQRKSQRFFLAVGFTKPHLPFVAPRKYWDLFEPSKIGLPPNPRHPIGAPTYALGDSGELYGYDSVPRNAQMSDQDKRRLRHGYLAATAYMDAQVGRVLRELDRLGLKGDTVVIFWGDNGFKLGDYAAWTKTTNVMLDVRIPLIIRAPGIAVAGGRVRGMVEVVDVYPTLLDLFGLPAPAELEGESFAPLLRAPKGKWKEAVFTQSPQVDHGRAVMGYSIVTEHFRLSRWLDRGDRRELAVELYDHDADPSETRNVASEPAYEAAREELLARLKAGWRGAVHANIPR